MKINAVTLKNTSQKIVLGKSYYSEQFLKKLHNVNDFFTDNASEILKNDDATTVAKVTLENKAFIIKRYNNRGKLHALKRYFLSRAKQSWLCAHRLLAYGINTAQPVAYIEEGRGKLKTSFFVSEYIEGISAWHFFENVTAISSETEAPAIAIINLLNHLFRMPISHGDLKSLNIILSHDKAYFIDLDGAQRHFSKIRWHYRQRRDKKRFLKNWLSRPKLYEYFASKLI